MDHAIGKGSNDDVWDNNEVKGKSKGKEDVWDRRSHEPMAKSAGKGKGKAKAKAQRHPVGPELVCKPRECGFAGSYKVIHHCPSEDLVIEIFGGDPSRRLEEWVVSPHGRMTLPISSFSEGRIRTVETCVHPVLYCIIELIDNRETVLLRAIQQASEERQPAPQASKFKYDPSRSSTTQRAP